MTEEMIQEQNESPNTKESNETSSQQLYAGKFKSIEDLEAGYKNAAKVFDENQQLKSQLESFTKLPEYYKNPSDIELDETRLADIKARAKESGMTQAQYERFVKSDKERLDKMNAHYESSKKEVGEENLNLLQDFINKAYPKEISEGVLKAAIVNKEARQAILNQREQSLSNIVPGIGNVSSGGYSISDDEIKKAYDKKENTKSLKDIEHYMDLLTRKTNRL